MTNFFKSLMVAGALALSTPAFAEAETYKVDASHTSVQFYVNHLGFTDMQGEFNDVDAELHLDLNNLEATTLTATLNTVGVDMDDDKLNAHLKTADFFNAEAFPTLTFKSTGVTKTGDKTAKMAGELTMLGVTLPVELDVEMTGDGVHPFSKKYTVGFHATGTLKRSAWGMEYLVGGVGDDVRIDIAAEFYKD